MSPARRGSGLSVTVLGCSGSYPGPGEACSGYLVEGGGVRVAVDLGPGSLANLQRHCELTDLDAVVLSHAHPDHWTDATGLWVALTYGSEREGLPVYGTERTGRLLADLVSHVSPTFSWQDTGDGDTIAVGDLRMRLSRTDHYIETLAVRVDLDERSFAYSADTGPGWSFDRLGPGVDLALCESTYPTREGAEGVLHLAAPEAGAMARAAGVRNLVLTHLWPTTDPDEHRRLAGEAFGAPVEVAETNRRYEL